MGIGRGDFKPLLAWLRTHVHSKGSSLGTNALLQEGDRCAAGCGCVQETHRREVPRLTGRIAGALAGRLVVEVFGELETLALVV